MLGRANEAVREQMAAAVHQSINMRKGSGGGYHTTNMAVWFDSSPLTEALEWFLLL